MDAEHSIRILYMEDDEGLARLFKRRLSKRGYDVHLAQDGQEGLDACKTGKFDLVVLDHHMPVKNGLEVMAELAAQDDPPLTIMVTGAGDEGTAVEALKMGALDYIVKDPDGGYLELMPAVIERTLERQALIDEKKQAEEQLRLSQERLELALRGADLGLWDITLALRQVRFNDQWGRIIGLGKYQRETTLEQWIALIHPDDEPAVRRRWVEHLRGGTTAFESEHRMKASNGEWKWILARGRVVEFDERGEPMRVAGTHLDVSDRKRAQDLLVQTERLKGVGELASGVAHNFNNLLQVILTGAQLVALNLDLQEIDEAKAYIKQIIESSRVGSEAVRRLQSFAKLRSDDSDRHKVFNLSQVVDQACEMTKTWWKIIPERKGVTIDLHRDLQEACLVEGAEQDLFEVAINLIKNASEALPHGGTIRVTTRTEEANVALTVKDDGMGAPKELLGRIFQPFFTTKGYDRSGLGLATSQGIVARLGGKIVLETEEGKGAEFTVTLPRAYAQPEEECEADAGAAESWRVLVVDDMAPVVQMIKDLLTYRGHKVEVALSGEDALRAFEKRSFDVVICDLVIPDTSGWNICSKMREMCESKGMPKPAFILMTGWGDQSDEQERIAEAGVDGLIEKPVDVNKLMRTIERVIK